MRAAQHGLVGRRLRFGPAHAAVGDAPAARRRAGGEFDDIATRTHPILGLTMPVTCDGVDDKILDPGTTWEDPDAYDAAAGRLRNMFRANYDKQGYAAMGIAAVM